MATQARRALIDSLEVGDLILLGKSIRVVRDVRKAGETVRGITLAIRRCSWTRRPYTVVGRADLYYRDLEVLRRGFGVHHGPMDVLIQAEVERRSADPSLLECCDVIGVVT